MAQNTDVDFDLQQVATALAHPRQDQPVIDINHERGFIDYKGKLGKASTMTVFQQTGYVVAGVNSDIDELASDECRIWFSKPDDLDP